MLYILLLFIIIIIIITDVIVPRSGSGAWLLCCLFIVSSLDPWHEAKVGQVVGSMQDGLKVGTLISI